MCDKSWVILDLGHTNTLLSIDKQIQLEIKTQNQHLFQPRTITCLNKVNLVCIEKKEEGMIQGLIKFDCKTIVSDLMHLKVNH